MIMELLFLPVQSSLRWRLLRLVGQSNDIHRHVVFHHSPGNSRGPLWPPGAALSQHHHRRRRWLCLLVRDAVLATSIIAFRRGFVLVRRALPDLHPLWGIRRSALQTTLANDNVVRVFYHAVGSGCHGLLCEGMEDVDDPWYRALPRCSRVLEVSGSLRTHQALWLVNIRVWISVSKHGEPFGTVKFRK